MNLSLITFKFNLNFKFIRDHVRAKNKIYNQEGSILKFIFNFNFISIIILNIIKC